MGLFWGFANIEADVILNLWNCTYVLYSAAIPPQRPILIINNDKLWSSNQQKPMNNWSYNFFISLKIKQNET